MAEEQNESQEKTQEATEHRIREARKKGQVAVSKDVIHWSVLFTLFLMGLFWFPYAIKSLHRFMETFLLGCGIIPFNAVLYDVFINIMKVLGIPILFILIFVVMSVLLQTQFLLSWESIKLDISKLSILKGLKRIFSLDVILEIFKSILKYGIIGFLIYHSLKDYISPQIIFMDLRNMGCDFKNGFHKLMLTVCIVMFFMAVVDYLYQQFKFKKKMRMSIQDIKEERKQTEGSPEVKDKIRQLQREKSNRKMLKEVANSTVVVTNPTHYAVALKYVPSEMNAPMVVAKGVDHLAAKIRDIANKNNIPIIRDVELARSLYKKVDIDDEITEEFYYAVAAIIRALQPILHH